MIALPRDRLLAPRRTMILSFKEPLKVLLGALLAVGLLAGAIPAWRASRVDSLAALRAE